MDNKVTNKNGDLSKVSQDKSLEELIDSGKIAAKAECSLRKNAFDNIENFKRGGFAFMKINNIDGKTRMVFHEFSNIKHPTDFQNDGMDEMTRVSKELGNKLKALPKVYKLFIKHNKKVSQGINKDPDLKKYKTKIQLDYLNAADHALSEEDQKLKNEAGGTKPIRKIYEALRNDLEHERVRDEKGNIIKEAKTWGDVTCSGNETVRKNGYASMLTLERKHRETLLGIATVAVSRANQLAKYYKYEGGVEQSVFETYEISLDDFHRILDSCSKYADIHKKYASYRNKLIAGVYGLKEIKPGDQDLYITDTQDSISINQAKTHIVNALKCLGDDYVNKINKCYQNNIIKGDKDNVEGSGYCFSGISSLDEHPIRFNGDGTSMAATTLAHELGHNIRNKYVKENNEINIDGNYLLGEIPSIVNSILSGYYFIKLFKEKKATKNQLYGMYANLLEYMFNNISKNGYVMHLADKGTRYLVDNDEPKAPNFEFNAYKLKKEVGGLNSNEIKGVKQKFPYGIEALKIYIPFINNVLGGIDCLQYYVGSIIGLVVADKIYKGDKDMLAKYMKFLKSGTTTNPIKLIKSTLGIDLLKPKVYTEAKHILNKLVNEFIKDIKI